MAAMLISHANGESKTGIFFNPGIKIGYAFGKNGGFTAGAEASFGVGNWERNDIMGMVIGYTRCFNASRYNTACLEFEYGTLAFGGALGLVLNTKSNVVNPSIRGFAGFGGYLSYRYVFGSIPEEMSLIGKLPLCTNPPDMN
jgi:hypothetical protein